MFCVEEGGGGGKRVEKFTLNRVLRLRATQFQIGFN